MSVDTEEAKCDQLANVSDIIGDWGRWQKQIFAFFFIGAMFSAWHGLSVSFYAPTADFWCATPGQVKFEERVNLTLLNHLIHSICQNMSKEVWIEESRLNKELRCHPTNDSSQSCQVWEYDSSFYKSTIISEVKWRLICN